ncbi:MAG TPA: YCF48-related protein, partial [Ignavibacteriaceae bacterium]|nr:YCF48-related protein [Ignavibacteriaceae bacterium]
TNGGEDWSLGINSTPGLTFYSLSMVSPLIGYAACADQNVYKTTDGGANWVLVTQPAVSTSDFRAASFLDVNNGYVFGETGLGYKTTDGGTTWTALTTGVTGTLYGSHFLDINNGFICGATGQISKTTDGGTTFTPLTTNNTATIYSVYMVNANVGYASGSSGRVRKTTDGGATWTTIDVGNTSATLYDISFRDENNGITIGSSGRTYSTTDGGATWLFESTGAGTLYSVYIEKASTGYSSVYLSGATGIVQKNSNLIIPVELTSFTASVLGNEITLNWNTATELNNQGFEVQKKSVNGEFEKIAFVAGFGTTSEPKSYSYKDINSLSGKVSYRLKQVDFDGTFEYLNVVLVDVGLPKQFVLNQNHPNPFNPSTTIKFQLPVDSKVRIDLFNSIGQKVSEILNSDLSGGVHEVTFEGSNLSSGIYYYTMNAVGNNGKNFTATKKMLLLK